MITNRRVTTKKKVQVHKNLNSNPSFTPSQHKQQRRAENSPELRRKTDNVGEREREVDAVGLRHEQVAGDATESGED